MTIVKNKINRYFYCNRTRKKVKISVNHKLFYLFALMPFNSTEDMRTHLLNDRSSEIKHLHKQIFINLEGTGYDS